MKFIRLIIFTACLGFMSRALAAPLTPEPTPYTAFPKLTSPTIAIKIHRGQPNESSYSRFDIEKVLESFSTQAALPDAPPLDKVRVAIIRETVACISRMESSRSRPCICFVVPETATEFSVYCRLLANTAAARETSAAARVGYYEASFLLIREWEWFTEARVRAGETAPQELHAARALRLRAERDLLKAHVAVANEPESPTKPATNKKPNASTTDDKRLDPPYCTAFPNLKPSDDAKELLESLTKGHPRSPAANATPLEKLRVAELNESIAFLLKQRKLIQIGRLDSTMFTDYADWCRQMAVAGASVEQTAASKILWYEKAVVLLKDMERYVEKGIKGGQYPPLFLNKVRAIRLQAEADLLQAMAAAEKAKAPPNK